MLLENAYIEGLCIVYVFIWVIHDRKYSHAFIEFFFIYTYSEYENFNMRYDS